MKVCLVFPYELSLCAGFHALCTSPHLSQESDIMERPPRDAKKDHLVNWKLIAHAYLLVSLGAFLRSGRAPKYISSIVHAEDLRLS